MQTVFPTPQEFRSPKSYTKGVGLLYSIAIGAFGPFSELRMAPTSNRCTMLAPR